MKNFFFSRKFRHFLRDERGVLSFEWIILVTLVVIGIIGGLRVMRDTTVCQFGNIVQAASHLDQSCGYRDSTNGNCPYLNNGEIIDKRANPTPNQ